MTQKRPFVSVNGYKLIKFLDKLPDDNVSRRIGDQLLRSGTSIIGNFIEGQAASSKKDFTIDSSLDKGTYIKS